MTGHFKMDPLSLAWEVAAAMVVCLATWWFWNLYLNLIHKPLKIIRQLRAQGIPGYPFIPVAGNLLDFLQVNAERERNVKLAASTEATEYFLRGRRKFGHVWTFFFGPYPTIVISNPDIIRQVYVTHNREMPKVEYVKDMLKVLGNGLLLSDGEVWHTQRRLMNPSFTLKEIKRLYPIILSCATRACDTLQQRIDQSGKGGQEGAEREGVCLWMEEELQTLTLEVVGKAVFGTEVEGIMGKDGLSDLLWAFQSHAAEAIKAGQLNLIIPFYKYLPTAQNLSIRKSKQVLLSSVRKIVATRLEQHKRTIKSGEKPPHSTSQASDFLQLMMEATDFEEDDRVSRGASPVKGQAQESSTLEQASGKPQSTVPMSEQQLMDECITFLGAGSDTVANLLTWTMLLLSQHQDWQEKAREEALSLCKEGGKWEPSYEQLGEVKVLSWVLYESLRLCPPAPVISRGASVTCHLSSGLVVPEGAHIYFPIQVLHHDPDFWGPNAKEFKPERFANGLTKASLHPGAYMPFSTGPRVCIGQNFALVEAKVILGAILSRFRWKLSDQYVHHPEYFATLKPRHGVPIVLESLV